MGSQEEIKIEDDFILIRFQNDDTAVFLAERQIQQGLIQFHFGIKGRAK
ncbi:MAG TPA: AraC family transcriptional regulator, partial [Flavobacterium sp.]|nr:AraC family transcriptional regulator [Flavobacterium sp.]